MFQAYHGVTGAEHQAHFNTLSGQGYRIISLSVYADPGDARYAAVWVQRPGPAWVAVHGVNSADYQTFFNTHTAQGYVPVLVTATGASNNAIFAAVFEKGIPGAWVARHGNTPCPVNASRPLRSLNQSPRNSNITILSNTLYCTTPDRA